MQLYPVPVLVFSFQTLSKFFLEDLSELSKTMEELRIKSRDATSYQWDNRNFRISNSYGTEFKFSLNGNNINLWDMHDFEVFQDELPKNLEERKTMLNKIGKLMSDYDKGFINCSECKKQIKLAECESNRFYAGIYCNDCWEGGVRQQEARENYN